MLKSFLSGAIVLASWAISMFFLRFQKTAKDRLFGFFAAAFILLGLERVSVEFVPNEVRSYVYLIRLFAFLLILFAIWDKNRKEKIT
jgi:hypothetical protein